MGSEHNLLQFIWFSKVDDKGLTVGAHPITSTQVFQVTAGVY